MPFQLLADVHWLVPGLLVAAAVVTSVTRSVTALARKIVAERARTNRLGVALEGSTPQQRAEIIRACGSLERADAATALDPPEESPSVVGTLRSLAPFRRDRGTAPEKE